MPLSEVAGRRILVTGHTGLKGAWLVLLLHELGAEIDGLALPSPTQPSLFELASCERLLRRHVVGDVRDPDVVVQSLSDADPEIVLHLAALTTVREGYARPVDTFQTNVLGTVNVLEAVRQRGRRCVVVVVSSDKCYENDETGRPLRETDPMGGADPYSASKGAAEIAVSAYRRSFFPPEHLAHHGVRLASARAGNVLGGGDWTPDALVPALMSAIIDDRPAELRYPHAVRPWQHLLEPLSGYVQLALTLLPDNARSLCRGWNFGPEGRPVNVGALADMFIAHAGRGSRVDGSAEPVAPEAGLLQLATDDARELLGWRPRWDLDEAVRRTVDWHRRAGADWRHAREACRYDILSYLGE